MDAEVASHGQDSTLEEALSHGSKQLQATAEHAKATSSVHIFAETPGCAGGEKGSEGSDRISRGHIRSPGSHRSAEAQADEESDSDAEAEAIAQGAPPNRRDLSKIMCNKCRKAGHYANRCPEHPQGASGLQAGYTPPESPRSDVSSSSSGSSDISITARWRRSHRGRATVGFAPTSPLVFTAALLARCPDAHAAESRDPKGRVSRPDVAAPAQGDRAR